MKLNAQRDTLDYAVAEVEAMALEIFGKDAASIWLRSPNLAFSGAAPADYLHTESGIKSVRQVLNAIVTGGVL